MQITAGMNADGILIVPDDPIIDDLLPGKYDGYPLEMRRNQRPGFAGGKGFTSLPPLDTGLSIRLPVPGK